MKNIIFFVTEHKSLLLKLFLVNSLLPFALIQRDLMWDSTYFSMFVIVVGLLLFHNLGKITIDRKKLPTTIFLCITFVLMLPITEILSSEIFEFKHITNSISLYTNHSILSYLVFFILIFNYLPSILISTFIIFNHIINLFSQNLETKKITNNKEKIKIRYYYACIVGMSFFLLFSTFPCTLLKDDCIKIWNDATGYGAWDDWLSFGHGLFVYLCTKIYDRPFGICLVQTMIWLIVNYYTLQVLAKYNKKALKFYVILLAIIFTPLYYLQDIRHDTIFSIGFLGVAVAFWNITKNGTISKYDFIFLSTISLFALLTRHGGEYIFISAIILLIFGFKNRQKIKYYLFYICIQIVAYIFVNVFLFNKLNVIKNPEYIKYGTPMAMVGGAIKDGVHFSEHEVKTLETVMPIEQWEENFNKYFIDDIDRPWKPVNKYIDFSTYDDILTNQGFGVFLIKLNLKILLNHPYIYLKNFLSECNIMWAIGRPKDNKIWRVMDTGGYEKDVIRYTAYYGAIVQYVRLIQNHPIFHSICGRGGISLFIIIMMATLLITNHKKILLLALSPVIIYTIMLSLAIPAQDFRYVLPFICCAIFYSAIIFSQTSSKKD